MSKITINSYSNLWENTNYLMKIPYLISTIREFDMSKANITALLYTGTIDRNMYNYLLNLPKQMREMYVGNMIANNKEIWDNGVSKGIKEGKRLLFKKNAIKDDEILSIKNDAVFLIGNRQIDSIIDPFIFSMKNVYDIFLYANHIEIYYGTDKLTGREVFDVKGVADTSLPYHIDYMINFLCDLCSILISGNINEALDYFNKFYNQYITCKLPVGYYREFNSDSKFIMKTRLAGYGVDSIRPDQLGMVDMSYNLLFLRDIYGILADIYFNH